ncbi:hypothetical protein AVEN_202455-1 [Araneus ventricosus]|uniref:Uncharacterized protein n=1 Tax=Araneus ventricosus TaxID=182803 RepID=A0A4Y2SW94_ARAVE|nr:hypothetical protein AVEN_202455-1 [Araneus ventricosus]
MKNNRCYNSSDSYRVVSSGYKAGHSRAFLSTPTSCQCERPMRNGTRRSEVSISKVGHSPPGLVCFTCFGAQDATPFFQCKKQVRNEVDREKRWNPVWIFILPSRP